MSKTVLITGASAGFGKLMTATLINAGHTVIATMRDPEGRNAANAAEAKAMGAHVLELDVTSDASVDAAVQTAVGSLGGIDVLINNAGTGVIGWQETFTVDDWKKVFEVNVFGVQRVTRAVVPHMKSKGEGLVIYLSSLLGRITLPFFGPYNATKFAVEAMAENYRLELSGAGIESCVIEPGGYGTSFMSALIQPSDEERIATLGEAAGAPMQMVQGFEGNLSGENAPDPQWIADETLKLVDTAHGQRPFRTVRDGLGMGEPVEAINSAAEASELGIYKAFQLDGMLEVKTSS